MTELVALLSTGKGTWSEVAMIIKSYDWSRIILITNEFGQKNFSRKENLEFIVVNFNESTEVLVEKLTALLKSRIQGTEVALNFTSGSGKEHMALLAALLKTGVGIRLIIYTGNGLKEI